MTQKSTDVSKAQNTELNEEERNRGSVRVLEECMKLQVAKARDYQNPNSSLTQADYYPRGLWTILDTIHGKRLRAVSVLEAMENDPNYGTNFESLEDTFMDIINYASFAVAWCRGEMTGQDLEETGLTSNRPVADPVGGRRRPENDGELRAPSVGFIFEDPREVGFSANLASDIAEGSEEEQNIFSAAEIELEENGKIGSSDFRGPYGREVW